MPFLIVLGVAAAALVAANIVIVPQGHSYVLEFLGKYWATWEAGLHVKIPILSRIAKKVSLKEQVLDFPPQSVITKDNVSMKIDTVIYLRIVQPKLFAYGVESPLMAIENLTATTLRNIIGEMELDATLTGRDAINGKMQGVIDEATDPWGIKVSRVEVKNIIPPAGIQEPMEKQMKAERERREQILRAEGEKKAAVLTAEGNKEALVLQAEAEKEAALLAADAERQRRVMEAEGEAEAVRRIAEAQADGLEALKRVMAPEQVVQLRSLETLQAMADGQATKIVIPSDIQGMAGTLTALAGAVMDKRPPAQRKAPQQSKDPGAARDYGLTGSPLNRGNT